MSSRWDAMASLIDAGRRALYDYVQRAGHPVTREEAAAELGISRGLAAFHLDKLADAGLLRTRYQAAPDLPRGRGRAPKVYEPTGDDVTVSVPDRRYTLAAQIMADAIADDPDHAAAATRRHAHRHGTELGKALRAAGADLTGALVQSGYEPRREDGNIQLTNCPFHALAAAQPALICGLNLSFLTGLLDALGIDNQTPRLSPHPGRCCVELAKPQQQAL